MNIKTLAIVAVVVIAVFFAGRWTGKPQSNLLIEDSLKREIRSNQTQMRVAMDSAKHYKILADTYFQLAEGRLKEKIIHHTKYVKDTVYIDSLPDSVLSRAISSRYQVKP